MKRQIGTKKWDADFRTVSHLCLLAAVSLALVSRGKSWDIPTDMASVSAKGQTEEVDTAVMCAAFKDGLLKTGLVIGLHASLPRDDSDYELFSTSAEADGLFVSINEQRQFILYFGKESAGYEITMPDPEFISDVTHRRIDESGNVVVDELNTTVFLTRLGFSNENIAIEAFTSSPFLSTVVKVIPLASLSNTRCSGKGNLGLGIDNSTAAIDVGQTGKTSKASMLRPIFIQRSLASFFVVLWLVGLWLTRKREDAEQADHA
jgi:hypothetical protein